MTLHLAGRRFGKLTVTDKVKSELRGDRKRRFWQCLCDCGSVSWAEGSNLTSGNSTGCNKCYKIVHGHAAGGKQSKTYQVWAGMFDRCTNKNNVSYAGYGGRGIAVCVRWNKFSNFLADMGEAPAGKSIERKNNNKNYTPKNCCWATPKEQGINRRGVRLSFRKADTIRRLYAEGFTRAEIARRFAVAFTTIDKVVSGERWVRSEHG